jgi:hypothetical protein
LEEETFFQFGFPAHGAHETDHKQSQQSEKEEKQKAKRHRDYTRAQNSSRLRGSITRRVKVNKKKGEKRNEGQCSKQNKSERRRQNPAQMANSPDKHRERLKGKKSTD